LSILLAGWGQIAACGRRLEEQSFVFLTLHKAGSTFATEIVRDLFVANGWVSRDFATQAFDAGLNGYEFLKQKAAAFHEKKTFFGPLRDEPVSLVPNLPSLTPIIHIRDPRDALVSYYYSICYSHVLPGPGPEREWFEKQREFYRQRSVDDFCLQILTNGNRSFKLLRSAAEAGPKTVISRYEVMVTDFSGWLRGLVQQLPIQVDDGKIESLDAQNQAPVSEDVYSHKRQVTPGDFRRKLRPASQTKLTEFFRDDLVYFGYSTEV